MKPRDWVTSAEWGGATWRCPFAMDNCTLSALCGLSTDVAKWFLWWLLLWESF